MEAELARAQRAIESATGAVPSLMRAPYGVRWPGLRAAQQHLGLLGVMWTAIGYDWRLNADQIVSRVAGNLRNGAIICLHDGRGLQVKPDIRQTLDAVDRLIPAIHARGLKLETVSQLLCPTN
jgi:peptidoglycan/xylan/chitin deacetylase (PgdA/CDA1 family)